MDNIKKLKRTRELISILTKYGFDDLILRRGIRRFVPFRIFKKSQNNETDSSELYDRILKTTEEMGSTFVKLGQLMSTRDDLLPKELCIKLSKLKDEVTPEKIDIKHLLSNQFNINTDEVFCSIDEEPFAAASLSQIYKARLKDGEKDVIFKVKRTGVNESTSIDLALIKDIAVTAEKYYNLAQNIGLAHIVQSFEKSILEELSFLRELNNIDKFKYNFRNCDTTYVPTTYHMFSNDDILCMEYVEGIKITDKKTLIENGLSTKTIATTTIDLYLKQIFDYGFFHGDPHGGNILVLKNGKVAFIDFGSVGRLYSTDRESLSNFFIYILKKDAKRLIEVIKTMSVSSHIENEAEIEHEIAMLIDEIDQNSIENLDLQRAFEQFSNIVNKNRIILPDYLYFMLRGIILLEGVGRDICPEINVFEIVKPYGKKLIREKLSPDYISKKIVDSMLEVGELLHDFPSDLRSLMKKLNSGKVEVTHNLNGLNELRRTFNRVVVALLVFALSVVSSILVLAEVPPIIFNISLFGLLGIMLSGIIALIVIVDIFRGTKKKIH